MIIRAITRSKHSSQTTGWLYLILGMIIMLCLGTVYSWSVFRIAIEKHFNIGTMLSGLPYLISLAVYALSMLMSGRFLDRPNPHEMAILGGLLVGLGWILSSYAQSIYGVALFFGVITGAGVGLVYGVPITVTARWFPKRNGLMVGLVLVGFGLSPLITAPLAGYLINNFGLFSAFRIFGIGFMLLIPILSIPLKYPKDQDKLAGINSENINSGFAPKEMVKTQSFWGVYLSFIIGTLIGLLLIGLTGNIGIEMFGLSSAAVAMLMSIFAVFNGIGRPFFGWVVNNFSIKRAMLFSYLLIILAAGFILLVKNRDALVYAVAFSVFWFNLGGWLAMAPAATLMLFGQKYYGQNYGIVFTAYGIGAIIGVVSSGLIRDWLMGFEAVFTLVAVMSALGVTLSQRLISNTKIPSNL